MLYWPPQRACFTVLINKPQAPLPYFKPQRGLLHTCQNSSVFVSSQLFVSSAQLTGGSQPRSTCGPLLLWKVLERFPKTLPQDHRVK